jgi:hypothetical protein
MGSSSPIHPPSRRNQRGRRKGGAGVAGGAICGGARGRRPAGLPRRRRPAGEAAGRGNARAWTAEPEQFKSPTPEAGAARGRKKPVQPLLPLLQPVRHRPLFCLLFTELFNTASPERQGAGLQHQEEVAVEAMDRAALLPLLQAVPLLVTTSSPPCPERKVINPPRPCCGPSLRAEAGPSLVSSLLV